MRLFLNMLIFTHNLGNWLIVRSSRVQRTNYVIISSERCGRHCLSSLAVLCILSGEQAKNTHAQQIMSKVLDGATWINIHQLPVMLCFVTVIFVCEPCFMN